MDRLKRRILYNPNDYKKSTQPTVHTVKKEIPIFYQPEQVKQPEQNPQKNKIEVIDAFVSTKDSLSKWREKRSLEICEWLITHPYFKSTKLAVDLLKVDKSNFLRVVKKGNGFFSIAQIRLIEDVIKEYGFK